MLAVLLGALAFAEPRSIFYVYDELNRLTVVADQQGDVAVYAYDAVGNIIRIERFDATASPGAVGISYFTSQVGTAGMTVQIFGKGFDPTPGQNTVRFNGVEALITAAAPNRLLVTVPIGATTGVISVSAPAGSATAAQPFRVIGVLSVVPPAASIVVNGSVQFTATEGGTPTSNVRWAVNGVAGGSSANGTISPAGLYIAPGTPIATTVTATSRDLSTLSASALVTVIPPLPSFAASRVVTVSVAEPALASIRGVTSTVSVALEPAITGVSPASVGRGATVSVAISGAGFGGASGLVFLRNGVADSAISAANLLIGPEGTTATADVTVAGAAIGGGRVVQIVTPVGTSSRLGTGKNVLTVQ